MRNSPTSLAKVARVRDDTIPVGQTARLFLRCHCGARPTVTDDRFITCYGCGSVYTRDGWTATDRVLN